MAPGTAIGGAAAAGTPLIAVPPQSAVPHRLATPVLMAVINAVQEAWKRLPTASFDGPLAESIRWDDEDDVTRRLGAILNRMRNSKSLPYFTSEQFDGVVVDAKFPNHDGTKLDAIPDLTFRTRVVPAGDDGRHGIFVECKVIGAGTRTIPNYVIKGLYRYVVGDYAWAMDRGLMLAYVRKAGVGYSALKAHLARTRTVKGRECKPMDQDGSPNLVAGTPRVAIPKTRHKRPLVKLPGGEPGPIEVFHVWLNCP